MGERWCISNAEKLQPAMRLLKPHIPDVTLSLFLLEEANNSEINVTSTSVKSINNLRI